MTFPRESKTGAFYNAIPYRYLTLQWWRRQKVSTSLQYASKMRGLPWESRSVSRNQATNSREISADEGLHADRHLFRRHAPTKSRNSSSLKCRAAPVDPAEFSGVMIMPFSHQYLIGITAIDHAFGKPARPADRRDPVAAGAHPRCAGTCPAAHRGARQSRCRYSHAGRQAPNAKREYPHCATRLSLIARQPAGEQVASRRNSRTRRHARPTPQSKGLRKATSESHVNKQSSSDMGRYRDAAELLHVPAAQRHASSGESQMRRRHRLTGSEMA